MRVLLRKRRTNLYYVGADQHTGIHHLAADHHKALDFDSVPRAAKFTFEQHLSDMAIILRYDWEDVELALPVLPEWCLLDESAVRPLGEPVAAGGTVLS
jgi:hypothetical protein